MNNIRIIKFGGTSLANKERFQAAIDIIKIHLRNNEKLIIVVSAMAGYTNKIISDFINFTSDYDSNLREYDVALHSGELVSASLMASLLNINKIKSISISGWQVPIITNDNFSDAHIIEIKSENIMKLLDNNIIPVVTGFQGIDSKNNITTLGRSGSDTTASALAYKFNAKICYIYTDVEGIYSADPRIVKDAKKISEISYEEMLEISASGAQVITSRAVRLAYKKNFILDVRSSFIKSNGTKIMNKNDIIEKNQISAVVNNSNIAVIYLFGKHKDNIVLVNQLAKNNIKILSIIYRESKIEIIINLNQYSKAEIILKDHNYNYQINKTLSIVSIIGLGIKDEPEILASIMQAIKDLDIKLYSLISSEFKITLLIDEDNSNHIVTLLHQKFIK